MPSRKTLTSQRIAKAAEAEQAFHTQSLARITQNPSRYYPFQPSKMPQPMRREAASTTCSSLQARAKEQETLRFARKLEQLEPSRGLSVRDGGERFSARLNSLMRERRKKELARIGVENLQLLARLDCARAAYTKGSVMRDEESRLRHLAVRCEYPFTLEDERK